MLRFLGVWGSTRDLRVDAQLSLTFGGDWTFKSGFALQWGGHSSASPTVRRILAVVSTTPPFLAGGGNEARWPDPGLTSAPAVKDVDHFVDLARRARLHFGARRALPTRLRDRCLSRDDSVGKCADSSPFQRRNGE